MKLDDHGTAFFVEDVSESEDDEIPPELATSPIPGQGLEMPQYPESNSHKGSPVNRSLIEEFNACDDDNKNSNKVENKDTTVGEKVDQAPPETSSSSSNAMYINNAKGKLNRKKRKRRQLHRHSRSGSKTSLKEMVAADQEHSSESGDGSNAKPLEKTASEEVFDLEDNDNDGDLDEDDNDTPINSVASSTPRDHANVPNPSTAADVQDHSSPSHHFATQKSDGNESSFLQSRLGDEAIESILDSQEKMIREEDLATNISGRKTDYFSEPEMTSPNGSRPATPVLSDTEYETKRQKSVQEEEQSWEWGKMPTTAGQSENNNKGENEMKSEEQIAKEAADLKRQKSWSFSFWKPSQTSKDQKETPGVYLDDLKDDEEMMAIYVGSSRHDHGISPAVDDDAESGNGPSLPMSPHSVEGAIGGKRVRYDSSDEEFKHMGSR